MFNFILKKTAIFQAVQWAKIFNLITIFRKILFLIFGLLLLLFLYGFFSENFSDSLLKILLGSSFVFLAFIIALFLKEIFFNLKLKNPKLKHSLKEAVSQPGKFNLADFLSFEAAKAVSKTIKYSRSHKLASVSSTVLTYFLLKDNPELKFVFARFCLDRKEIEDIFKTALKTQKKTDKFNYAFSQDFQRTIFESFKIAEEKGHGRIEVGDLIASLSGFDPIFKKILIDSKLRREDVENLTWWMEIEKEKIKRKKRFWEWENLLKRGSIGKDWAAGYSVTLDKFSNDLSKAVASQGFPETIGCQDEIEQAERVLARREINNILLVGDPGVGKGEIILGIARKSFLGKSLPEVNHKRFVQLDLASVIAQTESNEEVESILDRIFQEVVKAGNIILVINDFHKYVEGGARPGVVDITGVISKYLNLSD